MNGELVAWEDAKVHVLTHALHYGTGVFEGVRAYETAARHRDLPPPGPHRPAVPLGRDVLHGHPVHEGARSARRRTRRSSRNGLKSCYIRPLVYRGAGPMGLYPLDCPVDVMIAVWEWGAYLGDEGKQRGVPRQGRPRGAGSPPGRADPAGQGHRPVPQLRAGQDRGRQGRLRGGDPARPARLRLRGHRREPVRRQGRRDRHAGLQLVDILGGINRAVGDRRSRATSATRSSSATSPAASSTAPTRSS